MKSKSLPEGERSPAELTFAWLRGDEALVRFWCSLLLASGIFVALWLTLRIGVPVSVASDPPRVGKAQLIVVDENSHPSLRELLSARNLPSLAVEESVGEVPLVADMLAFLGLPEEAEETLTLYPAPELAPELNWPVVSSRAVSLPPLPELDESLWPRSQELTARESAWMVRLTAKGQLAESFPARTVPWEGDLPGQRRAVWSLVFDDAGALVLALPTVELQEEQDPLLRRFLEEQFASEAGIEDAPSGLIEIEFLPADPS